MSIIGGIPNFLIEFNVLATGTGFFLGKTLSDTIKSIVDNLVIPKLKEYDSNGIITTDTPDVSYCKIITSIINLIVTILITYIIVSILLLIINKNNEPLTLDKILYTILKMVGLSVISYVSMIEIIKWININCKSYK
jgi:large-conductance mechanosensitive channel